MTREEAKRVLEIHLEHWQRLTKEKICTEQEGVETISAFDMTIKALEQQPCEDCISREALQEVKFSEATNDYESGWNDAIDSIILHEPSVTPQQPCEDAISREQVLYEAIYYADRPTDTFIKNVLKQLPSVTPTRPKGKWMFTTHYATSYRVCSICNCQRIDDNSTGWNFCPYCGTDMRGEEE